jgi:hypothetical protein
VPEGSAAPQKICVVCKQDCASRPRTKDAQGRYTCRSCLDTQQPAPRQNPAPAPRAKTPAPVAVAPASPAKAPPAPARPGDPCPLCDAPIPSGAGKCPACGFDKAASKARNAAAHAEARAVDTDADDRPGLLAGLVGNNPVFWIVGGLVGGAVGAAIWAGIMAVTGIEIGYVAWLVGITTGFGVAVVARDRTDWLSGTIAAVIALAAIAGGRYVGFHLIARDLASKGEINLQMTDDLAVMWIATEIADEREAKGEKLAWPMGMTNDDAVEEGDFPKDVWAAAEKRWANASPEWREDHKKRHTLTTESLSDIAFMHSFSIIDLVFIGLALFTAWGIGSGAGLGGDD